ncbi:MAG: GGDEF domain-containing protein [Kangiellaceae bacterium]|jgi:diguanylate cyclase (GGDEF)-like protein|nr:GGDEF domain-containing protein [Kangiellaceae bacterium]
MMQNVKIILSIIAICMMSFSYADYSNYTRVTAGTVLIEQLPVDLSDELLLCASSSHNNFTSLTSCELISGQLNPTTTSSTNINEQNFTLTIQLIIDENLKRQTPSLLIEHLTGADELYLNNHLINRTGSFPPRFQNASTYTRYYTLPSHLLFDSKPNLIQIKTYQESDRPKLQGISVRLLTNEDLFSHKYFNDVRLSAAAISLLFISLLMFFYSARTNDKYEPVSLLFLSLFVAVYCLLNHNLLIETGIEISTIVRWKILALTIALLSLNYYLIITLKISSVFFKRLVVIYHIFFALTSIIWPSETYLDNIYRMSLVNSIIFPFIILSRILILNKRSLRTDQTAILIGCIVYLILALFELISPLWQAYLNINQWSSFLLGLLLFTGLATLVTSESYWYRFKGNSRDQLTNTLNKATFKRRLGEEILRAHASKSALIVAIFDIEEFKSINDKYGYDIGDAALTTVSKSIEKSVRKFDLISRIADDAFAIAVTLSKDDNREKLLVDIQHSIKSSPVATDNNNLIYLSATVGAVVYSPTRHLEPADLIQDIQHAVTEGKMKKRGTINWFNIDNPPVHFNF